MKEQTITRNFKSATARVPPKADVEAVAVGGTAPDCFGRMSLVTKVFARGTDIRGRAFVCYYCAMSDRDTVDNGCGCSASLKEGELVRTLALTCLLNSAECDVLESEMEAA